MCGLAGVLAFDRGSFRVTEPLVARMREAVRHRGPDGACVTGPAHSGVGLHGCLAFLVKAALEARPYTIFGYKRKQVRDDIHSLSAADEGMRCR